MPQKPLHAQRTLFTGNASSDAFLWVGGPGSFAVQGDMDGGTASLQVYLRTESGESGDAEGGTYATVTDNSSGDAAEVSGLTAESGMKSLSFNVPPCYMKVTMASSTSPTCVAVVSRDVVRSD